MRVATYNLYLGADLSLMFGVPAQGGEAAVDEVRRQLAATDFPARARAIAKILVAEHIDLVGLQELTVWSHGSDVVCDFEHELTAALAELGAPYDLCAVNPNFSGSGADMSIQGHNAILVRRRKGVAVESECTGDFGAAFTVPTPMGDVAIARSWGWVDARVDGAEVRFVNTHTEAYDEQVRNRQRDELLARLGDPGRPVVLVGDFNAAPDHVGIPSPYVDAWLASGGDPTGGMTCGQAADLGNETSLLTHRIDYVWVRDADVTGCRVVGGSALDRTSSGLWPSDHACVVADVRF